MVKQRRNYHSVILHYIQNEQNNVYIFFNIIQCPASYQHLLLMGAMFWISMFNCTFCLWDRGVRWWIMLHVWMCRWVNRCCGDSTRMRRGWWVIIPRCFFTCSSAVLISIWRVQGWYKQIWIPKSVELHCVSLCVMKPLYVWRFQPTLSD